VRALIMGCGAYGWVAAVVLGAGTGPALLGAAVCALAGTAVHVYTA
jgi:hypothetical protein